MEERAAERVAEKHEAEGALHMEQARKRQGRWWAPTKPPGRKGTATAGKSAGEEVPDKPMKIEGHFRRVSILHTIRQQS